MGQTARVYRFVRRHAVVVEKTGHHGIAQEIMREARKDVLRELLARFGGAAVMRHLRWINRALR